VQVKKDMMAHALVGTCMSSLGGTRYSTYIGNWMHNMHMSVLDVRT
jgi:hypothetical protein